MNKKANRNNKNKNKTKKTNSNIPYHLDDKGRRHFDFHKRNPELDEHQREKNEIDNMKREQKQNREEKKLSNLNYENAAFKCEKCELTFTDNLAYRDHINGIKHNMKVGNSLVIKHASIESIKEKLLSKKREREELIQNQFEKTKSK